MLLSEQIERSGAWFFRWRSYLPLVPLAVVFAALLRFRYPAGGHRMQDAWEMFCLAVSFSGLTVRVMVAGYAPAKTSGRNTRGGQIAATLNTTGMYSLVRNPLYVGNYLMWLGLMLLPRSWEAWFVATTIFWIIYERIIYTEEEFLRRRFGDEYLRWAEQTPVFLPRLHGWRKPSLPFCWRTVLRREYSGFFALVVLFPALDLAANYTASGTLHLDPAQVALLSSGTVVYVVLRSLKRHSRLLHAAGR